MPPIDIKEFPISGPGSVFPALLSSILPALHFSLLLITLPSLQSRYLSDRKLLLPFLFPTSAFPAIVRHFLPSIFRAGFQKNSLFFSMFSTSPPCQLPCSTFFSARHLRRLSPGIFRLYHRPQTLLFLPGSSLRPAFPFFAGIGRNCPLSALLPIRFPEAPAQPAHNPKVLLSAHAARQMVLPGLKIKISYPYQCYHCLLYTSPSPRDA